MMRRTARVIVADQVWSVRHDGVARWAIVRGVPQPLSDDDADTAAAAPVWRDGRRVLGCARWATPDDMAEARLLSAGPGRIGGRS